MREECAMPDTKIADRKPERRHEQPKEPRHKPTPLGKAEPEDTTEGEGSPGLTIGGGGGHA
jgi:hypothetical protein